jgi:arylsulfatase A-like enzyme
MKQLFAIRPVAASASRLNIGGSMPDDRRGGDSGAYGTPLIVTPHADRRYAESMRFTDFHVSPTN